MWLIIFILTCASINANSESGARLLTSYLPASMQALAYYIDQLQYEPLSNTTVEPPFNITNNVMNISFTTTTTSKPIIQTTKTTKKPEYAIGNGWWVPPSWWQQTTTSSPYIIPPTPTHRPAIYAPTLDAYFKRIASQMGERIPEGYEIFCIFHANHQKTWAKLTVSLMRDICDEPAHDDFTNDVESLDNFLRLYDDNYGRDTFSNERIDAVLDRWSSTSTAGKKRVPPTKPYVEFLLVYDLLKRDAKAENLSKYEGYTEEILLELHELSNASAARQLYTLFERMLNRRDIQRSDVVSRIQGLLKELGNPNSATAKALEYIPAMQFLP